MLTEKLGKSQPLRVSVAQLVRADMLGGRYTAGKFLESEQELSKKYQVSRITVRGALDMLEGEGLLKRHGRRGVMVVGKTAGKQRPPYTFQGSNRRIVFIAWDAHVFWASAVSESLKSFCKDAHLDLVVLDAHQSHETCFQYLKHPPAGTCGVILIPYETQAYKEVLQETTKRTPVVCFSKAIKDTGAASIVFDNFSAGRLTTAHLLERWERPVYFIGYRDRPTSVHRRFLGWQSAMEAHGFMGCQAYFCGIEMADDVFSSRSYDEQAKVGYETALRLFSREPAEQGWSILTVKDFVAQGVYAAAAQKGLRIGRDVAVVGHEDMPLAERLDPPLSSVRLPWEEVSRVAGELILQMNAEGTNRPMHYVLPVEYMKRESSLGDEQTAAGKKNQGIGARAAAAEPKLKQVRQQAGKSPQTVGAEQQ